MTEKNKNKKSSFTKWLSFLFRDIFSLEIRTKNMEDPIRVNKKIADLNKPDRSGGNWIAIKGYMSLMSMRGDLHTGKNIAMDSSKGYAVKVFVNTLNGEIRLFPAILFEKDAQ